MAERKALEALIQSTAPEDGAWFELPAKLKSKQINNAISKYAQGVSERSVVALMDTTLLKSGKEGFLLTEHTMYVKMLYKAQVTLDDIREVTLDDNDITVTYHNGATTEFYASIYAEKLVPLLQGLITQAAPAKTAAAAKAPAPKKEAAKEAPPAPKAAEAPKAPAPQTEPVKKTAPKKQFTSEKAVEKEAAYKKQPAPKAAESPKAPAPERQIQYHNRMSCSFEDVTELASVGVEAAMYELGYRYKNGVGVPESKELAFQWMHKAALAGYEPAFISIAVMYQELGSKISNYLHMEYWLKKAVLQGHYPAEKTLSDTTKIVKDFYRGCSVGDIIPFGQYYDDAQSNKLGPMYWRIIAKEGSRLLVVSDSIIDYRPFSETSNENGHATWEGSDIRKWLQGEFWNIAFQELDSSYIAETVVRTNPSPEYPILADTIPKKENSFTKANVKNQVTRDRVFLLSMEEVVQYFYKGTKPKLNVGYHYDDRYPSFDFSPNFWFNAKGSDQTYAKTELSPYAMQRMIDYPHTFSNVYARDLEYLLTTLSADYWLRNTACFNPKHPNLTVRKILTVSGGMNYHSNRAKDFKRLIFKRKVPFDAILPGSIDLREYYEPAGVRPAMWLDFSD